MKVKLGDLIEEYSERNIDNKYKPVAVGKYGIRARESIYSKELAKDYSKNKLIYKGTLTIGMGSNQIDIGILRDDEIYSVSPAYHTYNIKISNYDYLDYLLTANNNRMFSIYANRGSRQGKTLDLKRWLTDELRLHDEKDQKIIVQTLNAVKQLISQKEAELVKLDNLIKARFVEMFGTREKWNDANWKIASIDEIIEKPKSGEWGQKDESGRGIGVIRTTNFSDGGAVYFNSITTRDIPREKLITKGIKNGDILIEKSGGSDKKPVGRVVLYTGESNKYLNNNFTAILRINNNAEVNNIFLFTFLYINYWQGGTKVFENKTTGIHNLNLKEFLNKTKIALPDMSLQNQFATFVAQVDKSKFVLSNELTMCDFYIRLIHDRVMHSRINLRVAQ